MVLARKNMVDTQIRPHRILNPGLILALGKIPRELFLPPHFHPIAYADCDLLYHEQRFLMAPKVFSQLVESAELEPSSRVLVVGCGTGYSLAILSGLCKSVIGIESFPSLAQQARLHIDSLGLSNVSIIEGPLGEGHPRESSFDVIFIEGTVSDIPLPLKKQLSDDKGRLVTIKQEGTAAVLGKGIILRRYKGIFTCLETFDALTYVLTDFSSPKDYFVF